MPARWRPPGAAHPRSRGEHIEVGRAHFRVSGSSPLTRGTLLQVQLLLLFTRLIPARARNTVSPRRSPPNDRAHPRSRGEHASPTIKGATPVGSSPLARGAQSVPGARSCFLRLIPTRAGNIGATATGGRTNQAHPRSRGEHPVIRQMGSGRYGSSPLVRGTQAKHCPAQISSPSAPRHSSGQRHQR